MITNLSFVIILLIYLTKSYSQKEFITRLESESARITTIQQSSSTGFFINKDYCNQSKIIGL